MKPGRLVLRWLVAVAMVTLRVTCRVRIHNDPRPRLQAADLPYIYSVLHAHQIAAAINREPHTAAMVSQSADGELLMPAFRALGIHVVRGSNRQNKGAHLGQDRGGQAALEGLVAHVSGGGPAILAVDGPRGPRNRVRKGIASLSQRSGGAVLNVVTIPSRRWILRHSWDRLQIPKPFSTIDAYFAEPLLPEEGESVEKFRLRIENSLNALEAAHDPGEAVFRGTDSRRAKPSAA